MLPHFILLGAQKASSTYLAEALRAHPEIFMPADEVPSFEDPDYDRGGVEKLQKALEPGRGSRRVGFKRASLLARPECPARIAEHVPDAKLIAIVRNPIDRAVSSLFNLMHGGKAPVLPVDDALRQMMDDTLQRDWPMAEFVLEYGFYYKHLHRYLELFDREQLLILVHDDLRSGAPAVIRRMYEFLEVDAEFLPETLDRRPMAAPYSLTRLRILRTLQPLYSHLDDDGTRRYRKSGPFAAAVRMGSVALDRIVLKQVFRAKAPKPSPEIRRRLVVLYRDDVQSLEKLLGRDLASWLRTGEE